MVIGQEVNCNGKIGYIQAITAYNVLLYIHKLGFKSVSRKALENGTWIGLGQIWH